MVTAARGASRKLSPASAWASHTDPAAHISGPAIRIARGPTRPTIRPETSEETSAASVGTNIASPACSGE